MPVRVKIDVIEKGPKFSVGSLKCSVGWLGYVIESECSPLAKSKLGNNCWEKNGAGKSIGHRSDSSIFILLCERKCRYFEYVIRCQESTLQFNVYALKLFFPFFPLFDILRTFWKLPFCMWKVKKVARRFPCSKLLASCARNEVAPFNADEARNI